MLKNKTKVIVTIAVLIALTAILSIVDNYISLGIKMLFPLFATFVPHFKIGIANIVIIIIILHYSFTEGLLTVIIKSTLVGLLFGSGITTFIISLIGSLLSFFVMALLFRLLKQKYLLLISSIGGFTHALGQIIGAFLLYQIQDNMTFLIYAPFFLIIGLITGVLIGILSKNINRAIKIDKNETTNT